MSDEAPINLRECKVTLRMFPEGRDAMPDMWKIRIAIVDDEGRQAFAEHHMCNIHYMDSQFEFATTCCLKELKAFLKAKSGGRHSAETPDGYAG